MTASGILRSRRLTGRPFTRGDWPLLSDILRNPATGRWLVPPHGLDGAAADARAKAAAEQFAEYWAAEAAGPYVWSLSGAPVGYAGLRPSPLDARIAREAFWGFRAEVHGRGYATEAATAALAAEPPCLALAWALPNNAASRRVMEKLGFEEEGMADWKGLPHVVYRRDDRPA